MARIGRLSLQLYVECVAKANLEPMNEGQQKTDKANKYHWETPWGSLSQTPMMNVVQSFQLLWRSVSLGRVKNPVPTVKTILVWMLE